MENMNTNSHYHIEGHTGKKNSKTNGTMHCTKHIHITIRNVNIFVSLPSKKILLCRKSLESVQYDYYYFYHYNSLEIFSIVIWSWRNRSALSATLLLLIITLHVDYCCYTAVSM